MGRTRRWNTSTRAVWSVYSVMHVHVPRVSSASHVATRIGRATKGGSCHQTARAKTSHEARAQVNPCKYLRQLALRRMAPSPTASPCFLCGTYFPAADGDSGSQVTSSPPGSQHGRRRRQQQRAIRGRRHQAVLAPQGRARVAARERHRRQVLHRRPRGQD